MALGLNNSSIWNLGLAQFFSAEEKVRTGIRLVQPYFPGRIPVVFVHGTASSPVWWAEMWNTLFADPVLREHYQFWAFNYASGNPITYTAGILRNDLMDQVKTLDPDGKDPALRQMVIIGHSQGGLLAKLTATDTGDRLWRLASRTNIDELKVDEKPASCCGSLAPCRLPPASGRLYLPLRRGTPASLRKNQNQLAMNRPIHSVRVRPRQK